jgi:wobble nucleotide-excising tRNase
MPQPTITKILKIQSDTTLNFDETDPEIPQFRRLNLIYGFNGSGKTTLSRMFSFLAKDPNAPPEEQKSPISKFAIELSDGTLQTESSISQLAGRLIVYGEDFVQQNFRWAEGVAEPVFYLGKEQSELSLKLETAKSHFAGSQTAALAFGKDSDRAKASFDEFKTDLARKINSAIRPATQYRANNVESDFATLPRDSIPLASEQCDALAALIALPKALNALDVADFEIDPGLLNLADTSCKLLATTIGAIFVEELVAHEEMIQWAQHGAGYHSDHALDHCLFCGNPLTKDRLAKLRRTFDSGYSKLLSGIDQAISHLKATKGTLDQVRSKVPVKEQIDPSLQMDFSSLRDELLHLVSSGIEHANRFETLLDAKKSELSRGSTSVAQLMEDAQRFDRAWRDVSGRMTQLVLAHNQCQLDFESKKAVARGGLKAHYLAESRELHNRLREELESINKTQKEAEQRSEELSAEIKELERRLKNHGPAAALINTMLSHFLGHTEIVIEAADSGYRLVRSSGGKLGRLSEGERTAITVCYFLSLVEAEGRKLTDTIVVLDDPISSLDTQALNYAFNLVKQRLAAAAQLIVLTHNLHFMNECKKWMKLPRSESQAEPIAALFFLECRQVGTPLQRKSRLGAMPKLIREYESEYHYMFSLVLAAISEESLSDQLFLLPNAMRKVLEIFLAFKTPGMSLQASFGSDLIKSTQLSPERMGALERLSQVASHGDNIDFLTSMSPMTVEETRQAGTTLLELIKKLDLPHYDRMCKLCR